MGAGTVTRTPQGGWERDERYEQLVELAPDGILVHDGERVVLANAAAVRLTGGTRRAECVGQPIDTFLDPPYLKGVQAQLTEAGSPAEPATPIRDTLHRLDGTDLPVEVRAVAFMDRGRPAAHLIIRDVSERLAAEQAAREFEQRLQQAQRMEMVGALAGGVAHEINNMMQVVLGFSDLLLGTPDLPGKSRDDVREIVRAADRAATVTRQLLAFSRHAIHLPRVANLGRCLREAEPVVRRLLGAEVEVTVAVDAEPRVLVDPGQLQQVILNLALNARDATQPGGALILRAAEVTLSAELPAAAGATIPAGRYGTLSARDTGSGMDADVLARCFEPFYTTKAVGEGTGLGLSAVLGMLTQNNGSITVESAPGQGSVFTVYLPVTAEGPVAVDRRTGPVVAAHLPHPGATILVVDDEPAVRRVAVRVLERSGWRVLQAPDAAGALAQVERHGAPHLLLTDLTMPGLGGGALARRMRERWPALPVIFMSGYSVEELRRQGNGCPVEALLQKPFGPEELVAKVATALVALERYTAAPRSS